jgi:hypothetical protein
VAEYLIDNSVSTYCGPLKFVARESAGSTLSMFIILYPLVARPKFSFQGSAFVCGLFDWSLSPSASNWPTLLIMKIGNVRLFGEAYLGIRTMEERRDPAICPIYYPVFRYPGS